MGYRLRKKAKKLLVLLVFGGGLWLLPNTMAATLTIDVTDVRSDQGQILVRLIDREFFETDRNGRGMGAFSTAVPAQTGTIQVEIDELEEGEYVVQLVHDENGNGMLDRNVNQIPIEDWGLSQNPEIANVPNAQFNDIKVSVPAEGMKISIRMRRLD